MGRRSWIVPISDGRFPYFSSGIFPQRAAFLLKKYIKMYARIVIRDLIVIFMLKFKILNTVTKDLNRLKVVLVEKNRTGVWLAG